MAVARGGHEKQQRLWNDVEASSRRQDGSKKEQHRQQPPSSRSSFASGLAWMVLNTLATIGIVFTNKAIFSSPALKLAQLTFACFHFLVTFLTLFVLSRPAVGLFQPRRVALADILPLALTMSLNVILPNLSLAFSTVTFYQIARILLTPTVAALNCLLYRAALPRRAILALVPACLGVGLVSYYDSLPPPSSKNGGGGGGGAVQTTTPLGILFALAGTLFSSLYTVWIAAYHRRLRLSSMQLLFNQAPVSAFLLLYAIPFLDTWPAPVYSSSSSSSFLSSSSSTTSSTPSPASSSPQSPTVGWPLPPSWTSFPHLLTAHLRGWSHALAAEQRWVLVVLSGLFASAINLSQFFIVARAGPVSSTVVGHVKTCAIVALGWMVSGRGVGDWGSLVGVGMALGGIVV
ncbi:hypothetical protein VTJ83DRAFT_2553 [Remersonia thermophila]|uniref:GDP-mannose transporter n=1 Tax=Remersonia thermophila TaxID=72144 RepID=A0ABR4DJ65_9PEZI